MARVCAQGPFRALDRAPWPASAGGGVGAGRNLGESRPRRWLMSHGPTAAPNPHPAGTPITTGPWYTRAPSTTRSSGAPRRDPAPRSSARTGSGRNPACRLPPQGAAPAHAPAPGPGPRPRTHPCARTRPRLARRFCAAPGPPRPPLVPALHRAPLPPGCFRPAPSPPQHPCSALPHSPAARLQTPPCAAHARLEPAACLLAFTLGRPLCPSPATTAARPSLTRPQPCCAPAARPAPPPRPPAAGARRAAAAKRLRARRRRSAPAPHSLPDVTAAWSPRCPRACPLFCLFVAARRAAAAAGRAARPPAPGGRPAAALRCCGVPAAVHCTIDNARKIPSVPIRPQGPRPILWRGR
ncbi:MAG: hypothetical protein J3K34DRAFT_291092 [Monoraphidium minutum]|nr:MAG: hypothetical protein J3K34DRAFT_291092 [Monoraphidium minutum]